MQTNNKKGFIEEKIIISLIFVAVFIIIAKIILGISSKEIGDVMVKYATNIIGLVVLFSLPYAIKSEALLSIDILESMYPQEVRNLISKITYVLIAIIAILLTYNSVLIFKDALSNIEFKLFDKIIAFCPIIAFSLSVVRGIQKMLKRGEQKCC